MGDRTTSLRDCPSCKSKSTFECYEALSSCHKVDKCTECGHTHTFNVDDTNNIIEVTPTYTCCDKTPEIGGINTHEALRVKLESLETRQSIIEFGDTIGCQIIKLEPDMINKILAIFDTATKELVREAEKYAVVKETQFEPHLFIGGYHHDPDLCPECIKPGTFAVIQTPPKLEGKE